MTGALDRGRESFRRRAWADAYAELSAADRDAPLGLDDLEMLAAAAALAGDDPASTDAWARAHQEYVRAGDPAQAVRCAFWLVLGLMLRGELAPAAGWLARAQRLAGDVQGRAEEGCLLLGDAVQLMFAGDAEGANAMYSRAAEIGVRFGDPDVTAMARLGEGQTAIMLGRTTDGLTLLDEAMVAVTADETSATMTGLVYCAVIETCQEIFDVRRAREWTTALSRWCASQPELVPYRGQCLVHRAEILELQGNWPDAIDEAQRACERLAEPPHPAAGRAFYRRGELQRLRGEYDAADHSYREASRQGQSPHPGLAQLRYAQGQIDSAATAIRQALNEAQDRMTRSSLLGAYVEIALAANNVQAARAAADELTQIAVDFGAPLMDAVSDHAAGAVLLAEGDPALALEALRRACTRLQELDAPYDVARVRVHLGFAYRALGDDDTAEMELDAARAAFNRLGAAPDLARVEELTGTAASETAAGLTPREVEVLRLVATGMTNRAIADELFLSEKTLARHVSNIFTKLGVSSRAAATAYAYQHDLA
ncbi:MAG TPA: LuxR C-terminal-related transcriptional regulator [Acidimicrobiia bacterium]|nr:LuxR C-terminal-related transcriptional regulator [Acidimicrobiia bacterium]